MFNKVMQILLSLMVMLAQIPAAGAATEPYDVATLATWSGGIGNSGTGNYTASGGQNKIAIRNDNLFIVKFEDSHIYLYKSEDKGLTFMPRIRVDYVQNTYYAGIPSMTLDDEGNIYVVYAVNDLIRTSVYFSKSIDGGQTFTPGVRVNNYPGMPITGYFYPIVGVDSNKTIYIIWGNSAFGQHINIYLAKSTDSGQIFTIKTIAAFNDQDPDLAGVKGYPSFLIGRSGELYLSWLHRAGTSLSVARMMFIKSEDGGNTFSKKVIDSNADVSDAAIELARDGDIHIIWGHVLSTLPYKSRIYFAKSDDNGDSFTISPEIMPKYGTNDYRQFSNRIISDKLGHIYAIWHVGGTGGLFLAKSVDGGATFDEVGPRTSGIADARFASAAVDEENNLYVWSVDGSYNYLTKFGPTDVISPVLSLTVNDTPCDNGGSITLNWTLSPDDPTGGSGNNKVTGYNIYRATISGRQYEAIGTVPFGKSSYIDNNAAIGDSAYYYIVRASDSVKESANSNEATAASARNLPLSPSNLTAVDTVYDLGGSITLAWTRSADDGAGFNNVSAYNIYRYSATDGAVSALASLPAGSASYMDNSTIDTDTYYYFAAAFDSNCNGESAASNVATGQSVNNLTALPGLISTLPGISPPLLNSLLAKLENATAVLNSGDKTAAVNILNALLNEIAAQAGKKITTDASAALTTYIQNLIGYIQNH